MIVQVIIFLVFVLGMMLVLFNYLKNKQIEREEDRRERLHEKQEQLIESLRAKKGEE
ncbi:hypothetical protein [Paraflavitalea speifideaquila]|uniref:hypothetical protein n=1 Tax=Paraflavitalea speifideaquila TaxID=3076558 RepID=UPI0028F12EB6|nr:hypothetical protein [Paraflavitalea speifideiaquila]